MHCHSGAGWRADLWLGGPVPCPALQPEGRAPAGPAPGGLPWGTDVIGADLVNISSPSPISRPPWSAPHQPSKPDLTPVIMRERKFSGDKGNFQPPKETPDHVFNHLSFQRAAQSNHLEVITEANFFFDIFY